MRTLEGGPGNEGSHKVVQILNSKLAAADLMSPEVCGVMLFRSVKYPLGSTTVCPDTESETCCDKREGDNTCYIRYKLSHSLSTYVH